MVSPHSTFFLPKSRSVFPAYLNSGRGGQGKAGQGRAASLGFILVLSRLLDIFAHIFAKQYKQTYVFYGINGCRSSNINLPKHQTKLRYLANSTKI